MNVGILGAGQLGMMLGEAAQNLGVTCTFLDPSKNPPAKKVGDSTVAAFDDQTALKKFVDGVDVVTYEFENVPASSVEFLESITTVHPSSKILNISQDRFQEKTLFNEVGLKTPQFFVVDTLEELLAATKSIGYPAVLKTRKMGYDGKGQWMLRSDDDCRFAANLRQDIVDGDWQPKPDGQHPPLDLILEEFVSFDRELSIIAVRNEKGDMVFYPLIQNSHKAGILRLSIAPAPSVSPALQKKGEDIARKIMEKFSYVGVLTIELFERAGELLGNEMAPRVHNSGHWTIEGSETSQFENHMRAVCGMELGSTKMKNPSAMINLIGTIPDTKKIEKMPGVFIHLYGKEAREGRKLGHITVLDNDVESALKRVGELL